MAQPTPSTIRLDPTVIEEAMEAMDADQLRALPRDIIPWLDRRTHARVRMDTMFLFLLPVRRRAVSRSLVFL